MAGVDANLSIVSHVPRKLTSKSPKCVRIKLGLKYQSPVDWFCFQGTKSVSSPSAEFIPIVRVVDIPIIVAMYFLAIACSKVACSPLAVPAKALLRVSSLPLKNLGANNKNSPTFPPYPRLPTPVILLTAAAI